MLFRFHTIVIAALFTVANSNPDSPPNHILDLRQLIQSTCPVQVEIQAQEIVYPVIISTYINSNTIINIDSYITIYVQNAPTALITTVTATATTSTVTTSTILATNIGNAPISLCKTVKTRKEWRNMTSAEQISYLESQRCLFDLPAQLNLGSKNRWEDLVTVHQNLTDIIHNVGQFLLWHRYFLHIHETVTRKECNYTGPMTWWDERIDAGNFHGSSLFSPNTWGALLTTNTTIAPNSGPCVTDGIFANISLNIGPGNRTTNEVHCLNRNYNETESRGTSTAAIDKCNAHDNYLDMWECVFPGPHGAGHVGIGGSMSDVDSSPGDPIFWLHHSFIDRN